MGDLFFKKIKYDGETVCLEYTETNLAGDEIDAKFKSEDIPQNSFKNCISRLIGFAPKLCEIPEEVFDSSEVRSVSFSKNEKSGIVGATICILRKFNGKSMVINTPFMPFESYSKRDGDTNVMPEDCVSFLELLIAEAQCYLGGDRLKSQGSLFDEKEN